MSDEHPSAVEPQTKAEGNKSIKDIRRLSGQENFKKIANKVILGNKVINSITKESLKSVLKEHSKDSNTDPTKKPLDQDAAPKFNLKHVQQECKQHEEAGQFQHMGVFDLLYINGIEFMVAGVLLCIFAIFLLYEYLASDLEVLPRSHVEELALGRDGKFHTQADLSSVWGWLQFFFRETNGQLTLSFIFGVVSMMAMIPIYMFFHPVQTKFKVFPPLNRNWRLHINSGVMNTSIVFLCLFITNPRPLLRLAACADVVHFVTTLYQMRIMMFGDRDILWPEYFWCMVFKLLAAALMFAYPLDPMCMLRYGLVLCSFAWQRICIGLCQSIFKSTKYTVANTFCMILGCYQAAGSFNAMATQYFVFWIYVVFLKTKNWVGTDINSSIMVSHDDISIFTQKSMRGSMKQVITLFGLDHLLQLRKAYDEHTSTDHDKHERHQVVFTMLASLSGKAEQVADFVHVDNMHTMLSRMGFLEDHITILLDKFGIVDHDHGTLEFEHIGLSKTLEDFCEQLFVDITEADLPALAKHAETPVRRRKRRH